MVVVEREERPVRIWVRFFLEKKTKTNMNRTLRDVGHVCSTLVEYMPHGLDIMGSNVFRAFSSSFFPSFLNKESSHKVPLEMLLY